jgi:single-stranded-DNA-specific exonuclease
MSLEPDRLEDFKAAFARAVTAQLGDEPPSPSLCVDGALPFRELDFRLLKELELLAPFGMGNPEPVFTARNLTVAEHRIFGGKHVKLALRDEAAGLTLAGKAWRQAENMPADLRGRKLSIAFTPRIDRYGGVPTIELTIKDWLEE